MTRNSRTVRTDTAVGFQAQWLWQQDSVGICQGLVKGWYVRTSFLYEAAVVLSQSEVERPCAIDMKELVRQRTACQITC